MVFELYKRGESYLASEQEAWLLLFLSALDRACGLTIAAGAPDLMSSKQWVQNSGVFSMTTVRAPHCEHAKDIYSGAGY